MFRKKGNKEKVWGKGEKRKEKKKKELGAPSLILTGWFPGDAILKVNGERVKYAAVELVEPSTRVPFHPL